MVRMPVAIPTGRLMLMARVVAREEAERLAMLLPIRMALSTYSGVVYGLMQLMTPVIFVVDKMANGILRLLHIDPSKKITTMTEAELRTYVDVSHEDGVIETEEREMIYNVFDFSDALAKDIMVPRIKMVTVDVQADYQEVLRVFRESMYTRLPVYKDDHVGIVLVPDLSHNFFQQILQGNHTHCGSVLVEDESHAGDGDEVLLEDGTHLKVQGTDQNRIVKVRLTLPEHIPDPEEDSSFS